MSVVDECLNSITQQLASYVFNMYNTRDLYLLGILGGGANQQYRLEKMKEIGLRSVMKRSRTETPDHLQAPRRHIATIKGHHQNSGTIPKYIGKEEIGVEERIGD